MPTALEEIIEALDSVADLKNRVWERISHYAQNRDLAGIKRLTEVVAAIEEAVSVSQAVSQALSELDRKLDELPVKDKEALVYVRFRGEPLATVTAPTVVEAETPAASTLFQGRFEELPFKEQKRIRSAAVNQLLDRKEVDPRDTQEIIRRVQAQGISVTSAQIRAILARRTRKERGVPPPVPWSRKGRRNVSPPRVSKHRSIPRLTFERQSAVRAAVKQLMDGGERDFVTIKAKVRQMVGFEVHGSIVAAYILNYKRAAR